MLLTQFEQFFHLSAWLAYKHEKKRMLDIETILQNWEQQSSNIIT